MMSDGHGKWQRFNMEIWKWWEHGGLIIKTWWNNGGFIIKMVQDAGLTCWLNMTWYYLTINNGECPRWLSIGIDGIGANGLVSKRGHTLERPQGMARYHFDTRGYNVGLPPVISWFMTHSYKHHWLELCSPTYSHFVVTAGPTTHGPAA